VIPFGVPAKPELTLSGYVCFTSVSSESKLSSILL